MKAHLLDTEGLHDVASSQALVVGNARRGYFENAVCICEMKFGACEVKVDEVRDKSGAVMIATRCGLEVWQVRSRLM